MLLWPIVGVAKGQEVFRSFIPTERVKIRQAGSVALDSTSIQPLDWS